MIFHKIFQIFAILTLGSVVAMESDVDGAQSASSVAAKPVQSVFAMPLSKEKKELKRTNTQPLTDQFYEQFVNTTDKVDNCMESLTLTKFITSLYIDKVGADKSRKPLLNEADQKRLADVLKGSNVEKLFFRRCERFALIGVLKEALESKGIAVTWE